MVLARCSCHARSLASNLLPAPSAGCGSDRPNGDEATAARLVKLPIWCFHGDADAVVPVARSRSMVEAVRAAGGSVNYTELAGVGHDSWTPAFRDPATLAWIFSQKRP